MGEWVTGAQNKDFSPPLDASDFKTCQQSQIVHFLTSLHFAFARNTCMAGKTKRALPWVYGVLVKECLSTKILSILPA